MRYRFLLIALVFHICLTTSAWSQPESTIEQARKFVHEFMDTTFAPGIAVSVGVNCQIVWSEGFVYADVEQKVPVWPAINTISNRQCVQTYDYSSNGWNLVSAVVEGAAKQDFLSYMQENVFKHPRTLFVLRLHTSTLRC